MSKKQFDLSWLHLLQKCPELEPLYDEEGNLIDISINTNHVLLKKVISNSILKKLHYLTINKYIKFPEQYL